jgi:hypothetical protein
MAPTLHTARLVMTPVGDHDLAPLNAHWNDPQVARWLWDATPVPLQTVTHLVARSTHTFQHAGWGLWALRPATEAPLIGACGLGPFEPAPGIELLYSLARLRATPMPRVQVGPHTYPGFRIRPTPTQVCSSKAPVAQWIEQRTSNSSPPVQAGPSPSISPGQRPAPVRCRPS